MATPTAGKSGKASLLGVSIVAHVKISILLTRKKCQNRYWVGHRWHLLYPPSEAAIRVQGGSNFALVWFITCTQTIAMILVVIINYIMQLET